MPTNKAQSEMREKFVGLYFDGADGVHGNLKKAASLAGYSWVTVTAKQPKLRAMIANEEARRHSDSQRKRSVLVEHKENGSSAQRSPVSGQSIPQWYSGGSVSGEHPTLPLKSEKVFEHPLLGPYIKSANGGALPFWCREVGSGGSVDMTSAAQKRRRTDNQTPSYAYPKTHLDRPLPALPSPHSEPEFVAERSYKNQGVDVTGEAARGTFGIGRVQGQTEASEPSSMSEYEKEIFYTSREAKERFAARR